MTTTSSQVQRDGHWFCAGHFIQIEVMGDPE